MLLDWAAVDVLIRFLQLNSQATMFMYLFLCLLSGWLECSAVIFRSAVERWTSCGEKPTQLYFIKWVKRALRDYPGITVVVNNVGETPRVWPFVTQLVLKLSPTQDWLPPYHTYSGIPTHPWNTTVIFNTASLCCIWKLCTQASHQMTPIKRNPPGVKLLPHSLTWLRGEWVPIQSTSSWTFSN